MPDSWEAQSQSQNIIAVRGLSRGCGTTSIAAHLAAEFGRSIGQKILLFDLSLWNTDLTAIGGLVPGQSLVEFGRAVLDQNPMAPDILWNQITRYHPELPIDILPGTRDWLECSLLRETNGQVVIREALKLVAPSYDYVVVDLGANSQKPPSYSLSLLPACATHQTVVNVSNTIINVFTTPADFDFGAMVGDPQDFSVRQFFVINRSNKLDRVLALTSNQLGPGARERTVFIPEVPSLSGVQSLSVVMGKLVAGGRLSKKEERFQEGIRKLADFCVEKSA